MIHFETSVHIDRKQEDVFAVVSDPETYPRWNSAVTYRYGLRAANEGTDLTLEAEVELERLPRLVAPLAGAAVRRGDDNFSTLKRLLEGRGDHSGVRPFS